MLKRTHEYDDIVNKPRPDQSERGKISDKQRAEQFAAFDALNSPDERLDDAAKELFCEKKKQKNDE